MMKVLVILLALASKPCWTRSFPEESVVSVYTTQPTTAGTTPKTPLDVYQQIASGIAERITSPIFSFLGIGKNKTENGKTARSWEKVELLDEPEDATQPNYLPVDNDISKDRDVEELLEDAFKKVSRKPEKITLYSSYLPVLRNLETFADDNKTATDAGRNDDDDGLTLDDVDGEEEAREGYFYYILEVLGSIVQLLWGGFTALFKPKQ